jgi:predicted nucleic acid-binding protein
MSSDADAWTAATALRFSVPLMTLHVKDFENIGDRNFVR